MNADFPKNSTKSKYSDYMPVEYPQGPKESPIVAPAGPSLASSLPMTLPNKQKESK